MTDGLLTYLLAPVGGVLAGIALVNADAFHDRHTAKMLEAPREPEEDPDARQQLRKMLGYERIGHYISWFLIVFFTAVLLFRVGKTLFGLWVLT